MEGLCGFFIIRVIFIISCTKVVYFFNHLNGYNKVECLKLTFHCTVNYRQTNFQYKFNNNSFCLFSDSVDLELGLDTQPNPKNVVVRKNISLKLKNSVSKPRGSTGTASTSADVTSKQVKGNIKENIPGNLI